MECYLVSKGIELLGFYPAMGAVCGSGDSVLTNMVVKSDLIRDEASLANLLMTDNFESLSAFNVKFVSWLHPELATQVTK